MTNRTAGWVNGALGVMIFSGSLPATRLAVLEIDPLFLTVFRGGAAGLLALAMLWGLRQPLPTRRDLLALAVTALGVVVGFPLLTALALQEIPSARGVLFIGLLPLSTAIFGVLRGGERPRPLFWLFAAIGAVLVGGFALERGAGSSGRGDLLMVGAVIVCGLGYAEGGRLARHLGGWQVICWALVLSLPVMAPLCLLLIPDSISLSFAGGMAIGYVTLFSMLIGFIFWYRGLALGGIAAVGQLQLLQPLLSLILAAFLLNETVGWPLAAVVCGVVLCVGGARRMA